MMKGEWKESGTKDLYLRKISIKILKNQFFRNLENILFIVHSVKTDNELWIFRKIVFIWLFDSFVFTSFTQVSFQ